MLLAIFTSIAAHGQYTKTQAESQETKNNLAYYHLVTAPKITRQFLHPDYTRPNNQLMSWPDYPLTPEEVMRRYQEDTRNNKLSNVIAKDIITSILSKKKKVAVIPKF